MSLFSVFSPSKVETKTNTEAKYNKGIEEIHNEFFTASEKLLADANVILGNTLNIEKCERLKALGFNSVPEVVKLSEQQQTLEKNKKLLETVSYYKREYPFHKFITTEQVKEICNKYSLVQGEIGWYKGFVPETNLKQIENFKLKEKDKVLIGVTSEGIELEFPVETKTVFSGSYFHLSLQENLDWRGFAFQSNDGIQWYAKDTWNIFNMRHLDWIYFTLENSSTLSICAPEKWMEVPSGYKLVDTKYVKEIEDPVVLCRVSGGYLIVTAWGDEASDPIVLNPINN